MASESWVRKISENDRSEKVLRLTDAKLRIPSTAFIVGDSPDPYVATGTHFPIQITWSDGKRTKHFARGDTNRYMITDRSNSVGAFYDSVGPIVTHIVITAIEDGDFLVTPLLNS
jgi:hypothetical protein